MVRSSRRECRVIIKANSFDAANSRANPHNSSSEYAGGGKPILDADFII